MCAELQVQGELEAQLPAGLTFQHSKCLRCMDLTAPEKLPLRTHKVLGEHILLNNVTHICQAPSFCVKNCPGFLGYIKEKVQHGFSFKQSSSQRWTRCSASIRQAPVHCQQDSGGTTKGLVRTLTAGVKLVKKRAAQVLPKAVGLGLEWREMEKGRKNAFPTVLT